MGEKLPRFPNIRTLFFAGGIALFVLLWPLDRRHLVFTEHSFTSGAYTEYTTIALYASDLAFLLLWASWLWYTGKSTQKRLPPKRVFWLATAFFGWVAFRAMPLGGDSVGFSTLLGWYGVARVLQGYVLAIIAAHVWSATTLRNVLLSALIVSGVFQGLLGTAQVLHGKSLGLMFLGEHPLSLETAGVAKVDIETESPQGTPVSIGTSTVNGHTENGVPIGTKVLRGYGTFPHPNVLASFLLLAFLASMYFLNSDRRGTRETLTVSIGTITSGLLLTFSRSAWISLLFAMVAIAIGSYRNMGSSAYRKSVVILLAASLGILAVSLSDGVRSAVVSRVVPIETDAFIAGRVSSFHDTFRILASYPLLGAGTGNGFLDLVRTARNIDIIGNYVTSSTREPWQYQYPHNLLLVLLLEFGVVGLLMFFGILYHLVKHAVRAFRASPGDRRLLLGALVVLLVVCLLSLTDHYLWTIQQGRIALWGSIGIVLGSIPRNSEESSRNAAI